MLMCIRAAEACQCGEERRVPHGDLDDLDSMDGARMVVSTGTGIYNLPELQLQSVLKYRGMVGCRSQSLLTRKVWADANLTAQNSRKVETPHVGRELHPMQ
jgi:hypothetical protein